MALLSDAETLALATWWPLIEQGTASGYTVTDIISAASAIAQDQGGSLSFREAQGIAALSHYGFTMTKAADALLAADTAAAIDPSMVSNAPWGRPIVEQDTLSVWQVKFTMTFTDSAGNTQTEFKTSVIQGIDQPSTVGELGDMITEDAAGLAQKYNITLVSAQPYQILAV